MLLSRGLTVDRRGVFRERLLVILYLAAISFTWATLAWGYLRWPALASSLIVAAYAFYSSLLTPVLLRYYREQLTERDQSTTTPPAD